MFGFILLHLFEWRNVKLLHHAPQWLTSCSSINCVSVTETLNEKAKQQDLRRRKTAASFLPTFDKMCYLFVNVYFSDWTVVTESLFKAMGPNLWLLFFLKPTMYYISKNGLEPTPPPVVWNPAHVCWMENDCNTPKHNTVRSSPQEAFKNRLQRCVI